MGVAWCRECNGRGYLGWFWRKRLCPTCKAETEKVDGSYLHPIPPRPAASPAPPPPVRHVAGEMGIEEIRELERKFQSCFIGPRVVIVTESPMTMKPVGTPISGIAIWPGLKKALRLEGRTVLECDIRIRPDECVTVTTKELADGELGEGLVEVLSRYEVRKVEAE